MRLVRVVTSVRSPRAARARISLRLAPGDTTANAVDVLAYYVESASRITARLIADVK